MLFAINNKAFWEETRESNETGEAKLLTQCYFPLINNKYSLERTGTVKFIP